MNQGVAASPRTSAARCAWVRFANDAMALRVMAPSGNSSMGTESGTAHQQCVKLLRNLLSAPGGW